MRWLSTILSKVVGCLYQALAKVLLPDAIHDHSRRKRILFISQPFSQSRSRVSTDRAKTQPPLGTTRLAGASQPSALLAQDHRAASKWIGVGSSVSFLMLQRVGRGGGSNDSRRSISSRTSASSSPVTCFRISFCSSISPLIQLRLLVPDLLLFMAGQDHVVLSSRRKERL